MLIFLISILCAETVQLFTLLGSFDIDDFIFNLSGACLGFAVVRIPFINRLLKRIFVYT